MNMRVMRVESTITALKMESTVTALKLESTVTALKMESTIAVGVMKKQNFQVNSFQFFIKLCVTMS